MNRAAVDVEGIVSWTGSDIRARRDTLSVEEPLEIRFAGCRVAVTMRTPGHDFDLVAGFLFTEGIIQSADDIASIAYCEPEDLAPYGNVVNVNPSDPTRVDPERWTRRFYTTSSCGICGKASIEAVHQEVAAIEDLDGHAVRVSYDAIAYLDARLREAQAVFGQTGGVHAAGVFDLEGNLLIVREDVGRHNAVDKVIGHALCAEEVQGSRFKIQGDNVRPSKLKVQSAEPAAATGVGAGNVSKHPPYKEGAVARNLEQGTRNPEPVTWSSERILTVSGRASFEIVQKALMARIPIVAAVSAPSSLAVDLARSANMTLIGFLRGGRFNVYSAPHRIIANETSLLNTETPRCRGPQRA